MGGRIRDENSAIAFIDENNVHCFVDEAGNFTCDSGNVILLGQACLWSFDDILDVSKEDDKWQPL